MHKRPNAETNNTHRALATKLHPKEHKQQSTAPSFPYTTHYSPDFQAPQSHLVFLLEKRRSKNISLPERLTKKIS